MSWNDKAGPNKEFAQTIFDAREIIFPRGSGKGGQRQAADLSAIFQTIASEGEYNPNNPLKDKNGLWMTNDEIAFRKGIHRNNVNKYLDWLREVGLVKSKARFNSSTINWVDPKRLRHIVATQEADRQKWREAQLVGRDLNDDSPTAPWRPSRDDLEMYFSAQASISEELTEELSEPLTELPSEGQFEEPTEEHDVGTQDNNPYTSNRVINDYNTTPDQDGQSW